MLTMAKSMKNYFKLNKENTKDKRDQYFIFNIENIETVKESKLTRKYSYQKTVTNINQGAKNWFAPFLYPEI